MGEFFNNATIVLIAILLVFSWAVPAQANSPTGSNSIPEETPTPTSPLTETPTPVPPAAPLAETLTAEPPVLTAPPAITVWYEQSLRFGQIGNPQTQVNILGNVSDPENNLSSLTYRLNNGPVTSVPVGPDGLRLENRGDFNIAINTSALANDTNTLLITATDSTGSVTNKTVTFRYTPGRTWPQRYTTNWSSGAIHDQAQVVDGLWQRTASGIRTQQVGYDRLIAIGDMSWTNYEILVPVTVHQWFPVGTDSGGVGMIARWSGHTGSGPLPSGWTRIGAYAYYSNRNSGGLAMWLDGSNRVTQNFTLTTGTTYLFKLRAEAIGTTGRYSFKIWPQGQPEPSWSDSRFTNVVNVDDPTEQMLQGSMLLVAHRVDATFGDVTVCPLNATYPLNVSVNGGGSVAIQPNKTTFQCGESVTLTARPNSGWTFTGWSGGVTSLNNSITFNVTQATNITANFRQGQPVELNNDLFIPMVKND